MNSENDKQTENKYKASAMFFVLAVIFIIIQVIVQLTNPVEMEEINKKYSFKTCGDNCFKLYESKHC